MAKAPGPAPRPIYDPLVGQISVRELLLHSKALDPISDQHKQELARIENLTGLEAFSEADVREEIITPILRAMGYEKGSLFSINREKPLDFLDKQLRVDYRLTLFTEDFWLIEAKRPRKRRFKYADLWQAVQYAIHPDINAALVVLCDGYKLEVFDREASLKEPVLRIERRFLTRDFDKLRSLLSPWQAWFFERRRVVRLVDKVFDREFSLGRVEEFKALIDRRLVQKRTIILDNYRQQFDFKRDFAENVERVRKAETVEIVEALFFLQLTVGELHAAVETLVDRCTPNSFHVLLRVFPDTPRDTNDNYALASLLFLMRLSERLPTVPWLPRWLGPSNETANVDKAVERLIELSLNAFAGDERRKIVMLYSAAARRILKILCVVTPEVRRHTEVLHALQRYLGDELSFDQVVSSPKRHLLGVLNSMHMTVTAQFVRRHQDKNEALLVESALLDLKQSWALERRLLTSMPNYRQLLKERDIGELGMTEASCVSYDNVGHGCLCAIDSVPRWKAYTLANHAQKIETLARLGSWQAREWLGWKKDGDIPRPSDQDVADRFFFGDIVMFQAIRDGYQFK